VYVEHVQSDFDEKTTVLGENPVQLLLCPPQIPHRLAWGTNLDFHIERLVRICLSHGTVHWIMLYIYWHGNLHCLTYQGSNALDIPVFLISLQFYFHVRFFFNSGYLPTRLHAITYEKTVLLMRMSDLTRYRKFPSAMHIIHRGLS